MALAICVEDNDGDSSRVIVDEHDILMELVLASQQDRATQSRLLDTIDPYGEVGFDWSQMAQLEDEIGELQSIAQTPQAKKFISRILKLTNLCQTGKLYLRMIGD